MKVINGMGILAALALCLVLALPAPGLTREADKTAPITTRQLLDKVAEAEGKVVMINFFAAFCPPCRKEIPGLINIRGDLSEDDFVIIGVAVDDDLKEMREFVNDTPFNYPTYYGGAEARYAFRIDAIPYNVIYDRSGRMVVNESGYVPENRLRVFLQKLIDAE